MVGIYGIHNLITDKWYVGQSVDILKRWKHHRWALNGGYHYNTYLQRSWVNYGEQSFEFLVLEECDSNELDSKEKCWIIEMESLSDGYNLCEGGNAPRGVIITDEMRLKQSLARLGANNPMYGKPQTNYHKIRMKEVQSGSKNHMYGKLGKDHHRSKLVRCIDTNIVYNGFREAERETGVNRHNICACCNGRLKTAGKLHWEYVE